MASGSIAVAALCPRASAALSAAVALMLLAGAALSVLFIVFTGRLVGAVPPAVRGGFDSDAGRRVVELLVLVAIVFVAQQAVTPAREVLADSLGRRVDAHVRGRVMVAALAPVGIAHLEDPDLLDKVSMAQSVGIANVTPGDAVQGVTTNAATRLQILGAGAVVASYHWPLAIAIVGGGLLARGRLVRESARWVAIVAGGTAKLRRAFYFRNLALAPDAAKETRVFGLGRWVRDRYTGHWLEVMGELWRERKSGGHLTVLWFLPVAIASVATLLLAADAALARDITLERLAIVAQAVVAAAAVYMTDSDLLVDYGAAGIPAVTDLEAATAALEPKAGGTEPAPVLPQREIRFDGVSFRYRGRDNDVYSSLDLEIPAGRSLAIVGSNGAGKTTMVKLLARFYEPTAGRITVDGIDLRELDAHAWRRQIAVIFQDFVRYELSAADNVGLAALAGSAPGGPSHADEARRRAAERAGILDVLDGLGSGWDTVLSREYEGGAELSGGQWQRVALARALFAVEQGAKVLVLDEPTASLDVRAEAELFDRFLDLTRGLTTILVSHRFSSVRHADRIAVLADGRVIEQGTHDQLMAHDGRYAAMFRLQASRFTDGADGADGETSPDGDSDA